MWVRGSVTVVGSVRVKMLMEGVGEVRKENVVALVWSRDLRIGWEVWSVRREVWSMEMSGGIEVRKARTAMPVPPRTARHQLRSVSPTVRDFGSTMAIV